MNAKLEQLITDLANEVFTALQESAPRHEFSSALSRLDVVHMVQAELSTLDTDLAIAQAAREWVAAKDHVSDLILQSPPSVSNINTAIGHEDAALNKLRAVVEKANTLTPAIADTPKPPGG